MALQCGTTNGGCNGKTGLIRVEYSVPESTYVRYKYPSGNWVKVINGTRFEIHQESMYQGFPCKTTWDYLAVPGQCPPACDTISGTIESGTYPNEIVTIRQDKLPGNPQCPSIPQRICLAINQITKVERDILNGYAATCHRLSVTSQNQICNPCTFKVFDCANTILYENTRDVCPIAEVIPSVYSNEKNTFNLKNTDSNQPLKVIESEANNIKSTLIQLGDTLIKKVDSPKCSTLFPKVCWDCEEDKCPPDTCSVDCGAHICCYNSQGIAVKTILK
jgi:hypothetical protein